MELEFLKSLVIVFGASALVVFLLQRINIPSLAGFLVSGIIIGPFGIGIVRDPGAIEILAEIGIILLLFAIGIEFSMSRLIRMRKPVMVGGGIQVSLTIVLAAAAAYAVTGDINRSVFTGFLVSLSSTAIVLKMLADRGETDSPHGRMMLGILIFQDICVVPLMLLTPALAGDVVSPADIAVKIGMAALIVVAVLLSARWIVPVLLHQVVRTRSRELFIITVILLCLGTALLTSEFGLSLALGAFLAGLVISESEYSHQVVSDILPFKESFTGLFFVSIGMLMDLSYIYGNFSKIVAAVLVIFLLKAFLCMLSVFASGAPLRAALQAGLGLAQIGEFSFVLMAAGKSAGIVTGEFNQVFLASSIITMMATPFVMGIAPAVSGWIASKDVTKRVDAIISIHGENVFQARRENHVLIIGFGLNGRNLARVLRDAGIPYVILEMNSDTVMEMKKKGEPIFYGDGTSLEILHKMNIDRARVLVVAISDPASARRIVSIAGHENPRLSIIVRTRYLAEVEDLISLGASEVIPEEFETSIEIFSRVLHQYNVPGNVLKDHMENIRKDSYGVLRTVAVPLKPLAERAEFLKDIETETYLVKDLSFADGYTIKELQLRTATGVTIIAVHRGGDVIQNPPADFTLKADDILLIIGKRSDIDRAVDYLESGSSPWSKYP